MHAIELLLPDGKPSGVFVCGKCRRSGCQDTCERCCVCSYCGQHCPWEKGVVCHDACWSAHQRKRREEKLAKAAKLATWDGWVYVEWIGHNEGYFENLAVLVDYLTDWDDDCGPLVWPEYAFVAEPRPLQQIDIQDVLERADDEAFEGASDHLQGLPELEAAFKTFYELNKNIVSYHADETRAIAVPRPTKV